MSNNDKLEWTIAYLPEVKMNIQCVSGSKKARLMDVVDNAIKLLNEQNEKEGRIWKAVWDVLHEGVSTDTVADQDWVYEQIRNRVEKTY